MNIQNQDFFRAIGVSGLLFLLQPLAVSIGIAGGTGVSILASIGLLNLLVFRLGRHYTKQSFKTYCLTSVLSCLNYGIILAFVMYFNFPSNPELFMEQIPEEMASPELEEQVTDIINWVRKPILIALIIGVTNSIFAIPSLIYQYYRYSKA